MQLTKQWNSVKGSILHNEHNCVDRPQILYGEPQSQCSLLYWYSSLSLLKAAPLTVGPDCGGWRQVSVCANIKLDKAEVTLMHSCVCLVSLSDGENENIWTTSGGCEEEKGSWWWGGRWNPKSDPVRDDRMCPTNHEDCCVLDVNSCHSFGF